MAWRKGGSDHSPIRALCGPRQSRYTELIRPIPGSVARHPRFVARLRALMWQGADELHGRGPFKAVGRVKEYMHEAARGTQDDLDFKRDVGPETRVQRFTAIARAAWARDRRLATRLCDPLEEARAHIMWTPIGPELAQPARLSEDLCRPKGGA